MQVPTISRRLFVGSVGLGGLLSGASPAHADDVSLGDALMQRRSIRAYTQEPVAAELVLGLLWAAFGVNRPDTGLHTAPSWRGSAETMIHVADANGVSLYDATSNRLTQVKTDDIRSQLSQQPFVATAPLALILVANLAIMAEADPETQQLYAHVDSAIVGQNAYLFCAANGLGTCLVGGADKPAVTAALGLDETKLVTFVMPVGHPA